MQMAYMNTELKLLNYNANNYFNKTCLELGIIPKYAHTKINSHNNTLVEQILTILKLLFF
jgi:hypothetical protein